MYQSFLCVTIPPGKFSESAKSRPPGKFFGQIPGGMGFPGTPFFINLTLFAIFKTSIINLPIEYLQIQTLMIVLQAVVYCKNSFNGILIQGVFMTFTSV